MMTESEIELEMAHIRSNRLGSLAEDRVPTLSQLVIAEVEAVEWRARYLAEQVQQKELL